MRPGAFGCDLSRRFAANVVIAITTANAICVLSAFERSFAAGMALNCAAKPSACGYPDATNTGVWHSRAKLKKVPAQATSGAGWHWDTRGWVAITGHGAMFSGYEVNAPISVEADNVIIRDIISTVGGEDFGIALRHANNVMISHCEIGPPSGGSERLMVGIKDIYGDSVGTRILKNEIFHTGTAVQIDEGLIRGNYIHDLGYKPGDHVNGITSNGSQRLLVIRHNTIFNQFDQTDAIGLFEDFGVEANRVIDDNLLAGGGYTLYAGQNPGGPSTYNIQVTNNRFSRLHWVNGGYWGPATAYSKSGRGNVWVNNIWDETRKTVPAP